MSFVVTEPLTDGVVVLKTSLGDILVELWKRECPKAVRNFVQLCLEGHYDGAPFHRIVPSFIAQTGGGDDCIYDEGDFAVETNQRLKFNRRGLVAMASDPNTGTNMSQFFFTLDATPELQNQHTLFGRVTGDSLFNMLKLSDVELEPNSDKPVYAPVIKSVEVRVDPFEDTDEPIRPRITAAERKEQDKAKREMKKERAKQREGAKRKGTKNKSLISFGDEAAEDESAESTLPKTKFKSAHDAAVDKRLSAKVLDDRGFSAELPPELMGPPPAAAPAKRRKAEDDETKREEKRGRSEAPAPSNSKLDEARKAKAATKTEAEKRKEEIAKVEAELRKMSGKATSDEESAKPAKKKRTGPSLLQLEREKYLKGGASSGAGAGASKISRGKRKADDEDDVMSVLDGFRSKLSQAAKSAPKEMDVDDEGKREPDDLHGIGVTEEDFDGDDDSWLTHSLKFRKDATLDQHTIDEYAVHDPLAKSDATLAEMRQKAESQKRKYAGEREERGGGGGRGDDRRGGGGNNAARYGGGGERYGGGDRHGGGRDGGRGSYGGGRTDRYDSGRDRPEVRGDWKKDRMSTADLA
ncbi:hypothetical protein JCM10213_007628 [Rhodosporidiobolus nylandii]